jgi:hypothetical protein
MVELSTPVISVVIEGLQVQFLSMSSSHELAVEETIWVRVPSLLADQCFFCPVLLGYYLIIM